MDKSHGEGDDQHISSSNLTKQPGGLEVVEKEGVSSTTAGNIADSSGLTEKSLHASAGEESSELSLSKSTEQLLKIFGNEKPTAVKTSASTENLLRIMTVQKCAPSARIFTPSSSTEDLLNTLETKSENVNPSSSTLEASEVFEKETPSSSSDLNPSSSTEELSKIFEDKTSFMSSDVNSSSSVEELPQMQENKMPSAKQLSKLQAKGRMTALAKKLSPSSDSDKPSSSSDDISSVDENISDRKETRTLPPFLKRNSRRSSPELWKYTKPIPQRASAVSAATESEKNSSSLVQKQDDHSFANGDLGRNVTTPKCGHHITSPGSADTRKTASKRKSPATKIAYAPHNRCGTCGVDPELRSPVIIIRYRNKKLLATRKGSLQSKIEAKVTDIAAQRENSQSGSSEQNKEEVAMQQEEDTNENTMKTQQQLKYEIMNQQVLEFFNKMQDYAEERVPEATPGGQQNRDDEDDEIFEMEDIN